MSRTRTYSSGVVVFMVVAAATLAAARMSRQGTGTIFACVNSGSGIVRIVDATTACRPSEWPVWWSVQGPPGGVRKMLTEINVSSTGAPQFLWEPERYDPAPSEIFLEVDADVWWGTETFRLHDLTHNVPIAGASMTVSGGQRRMRTANLAASFPTTPVEIAMVAEGGATFRFLRAAVLVQQGQ